MKTYTSGHEKKEANDGSVSNTSFQVASALIPFSLNVLNLSYDPPVNYLSNLGLEFRGILKRNNLHLPESLLPAESSVEGFKNATTNVSIDNISFKADSCKITAIMSHTKKERQTLIQILSNRCQSGHVDGDIYMRGLMTGGKYSSNLAFVPKVRFLKKRKVKKRQYIYIKIHSHISPSYSNPNPISFKFV